MNIHTIKLDTMKRIFAHWAEWDKAARDREGIETTPDTYIMNPPTWPSHGQIAEWVKTLSEAQQCIEELMKLEDTSNDILPR